MAMLFGKVKRSNILALLLVIGGLSTLTVHLRSSQATEQRRDQYSRRFLNGGSVVVNDAPTRRFRDNLRNESNYITCWTQAGFTNQFMNYVNMLYLATLTDRIPIIPPFAPDHHISPSAGVVPFGDIFDLQALSLHLNGPILEWRDVKALPKKARDDAYSTSAVEELGCWTTRKENSPDPTRAYNLVRHLGVDVSYTRVPMSTRYDPSDREDDHVAFPELAALVYPRDPMLNVGSLTALAPSQAGHASVPENHLACFDTLYYATSGTRRFEWEYTWSPAWRTIGRHLGFTAEVKDIARSYLADAFGIGGRAMADIPPFIAVHIRRGDFRVYCPKNGLVEDPFPPRSAYKKHVDDIKSELLAQHGVHISHVLVSSGKPNEIAQSFWDGVRQEGWFHINHTEKDTLGRYGEWYLPIIDVVIQSVASGFVGTHGSTYTLISQKRVEDWNNGVVKEVDLALGL